MTEKLFFLFGENGILWNVVCSTLSQITLSGISLDSLRRQPHAWERVDFLSVWESVGSNQVRVQPRPQGLTRRVLGTRLVRVNTQRRTDTPTLIVENVYRSPKTELRPKRIDEGPCFYPLLGESPSLPTLPSWKLLPLPAFSAGESGESEGGSASRVPCFRTDQKFQWILYASYLPTSQIFIQFLIYHRLLFTRETANMALGVGCP